MSKDKKNHVHIVHSAVNYDAGFGITTSVYTCPCGATKTFDRFAGSGNFVNREWSKSK